LPRTYPEAKESARPDSSPRAAADLTPWHTPVQVLNAGGCNDTKAGEARRIPSQAGFLENGGTSGRRQEENEGPCVCDPETRREEPPLRSSSGAGWRDEELGRPERAQS